MVLQWSWRCLYELEEPWDASLKYIVDLSLRRSLCVPWLWNSRGMAEGATPLRGLQIKSLFRVMLVTVYFS